MTLDYLNSENLPDRILGMKRLESLFNQNGYLICQLTGERIYDFDQIVAIFVPLTSSLDQVMAVHCDHAQKFTQKCLSSLKNFN